MVPRVVPQTWCVAGRWVAPVLAVIPLLLLAAPFVAQGELRAGAAQVDITPPPGTPSAGYSERMGQGMEGVHDPLLATALVLDTGEKMIVFVGVDHLGFNEEMVRAVKRIIHANAITRRCEVYLGSSHTHSGGGAHIKLPDILAQFISGPYDRGIYESYIDGAAQSVLEAAENLAPARVGVGYGHAPNLNAYRGDWPPDVETRDDVAVIKVTASDSTPVAVLFNFAAHGTVLGASNLLFSADYVGAARDHAAALIGGGVQPVFFNGAEGDVSPRPPSAEDSFERVDLMGAALAEEVWDIWNATETSDVLKIETRRQPYSLTSKPLNVIVLNDRDGFVTIPGEMSCNYDTDIKRIGGELGFNQVSILGLTNGMGGYIVTPESWRHRTYESTISFHGPFYGERMKDAVCAMLHALKPWIGDAGPGNDDVASTREAQQGRPLVDLLGALCARLAEVADGGKADTGNQ
ncbi:MAG: neutral/alkaline non-lysosomal ceramidase N-terminal domain-containing protein [Candidatus Hydrogenedentes bacterium]|nr:neutral/alkaline non-lysosomal ceramidase N-terminal domain-containing protein [Candidatus Hydrogenedentota bacterium]